MATRKNKSAQADKQMVTVANAIPNAYPGVVQFEPCSAPRSTARRLHNDQAEPTFTLKRDNRTFVYGVQDCSAFGDGNATQLNSFQRYGSEDYLDLLKVMWLHLFSEYRGTGTTIAPSLVLSVPIGVYDQDDQALITALKQRLIGTHEMEDAGGCKLKLRIDEKKLMILPESVGALFHASTSKAAISLDGNVLMVDVGKLTTDMSLFSRIKYQAKRSKTAPTIGMGNVAAAIQVELERQGYAVDVAQIDSQVRLLAGTAAGEPKFILLDGAYRYDVTDIYDTQIAILAREVRDFILNNFRGLYNEIVITGGGAYHLYTVLKELLPGTVVMCPNPTVANVLGGYRHLRQLAERAGAADVLIASHDNGNGGAKGISNRTAR